MGARAEEILQEVKALPASERTAFTKLFNEWQTTAEPPERTQTAEWPDFAGRMKVIFGERILSGDPQNFWDEERGREP